ARAARRGNGGARQSPLDRTRQPAHALAEGIAPGTPRAAARGGNDLPRCVAIVTARIPAAAPHGAGPTTRQGSGPRERPSIGGFSRGAPQGCAGAPFGRGVEALRGVSRHHAPEAAGLSPETFLHAFPRPAGHRVLR